MNQKSKKKHFLHVKKKSQVSTIEFLGLKNSHVLEKKIKKQEKKIEQLQRSFEKCYEENLFIKKHLKKNKYDVFYELWTIKFFYKLIELMHVRGFICFVLCGNFILLTVLFSFFLKKNFFHRQEKKFSQQLYHSSFFPYTIEVGSFLSLSNGQKEVLKFKSLGFRAYIGKIFKKNRPVYRVYVNEYKKLDEAEEDLIVLKTIYHCSKSFIRRKF